MTPQELGLRIAHIGINANSKGEADEIAQLFCTLLGLEMGHTPVSSMAGFAVEAMHSPGPGEHGHIGIHADSVEAAEPFFVEHGFTVNDSTRRLNPDGTTFLVYLNEQVAGFAIHLTREG